MDSKQYIIVASAFLYLIFLSWGKLGIEIDPEYLNGILTASSILYGFLLVLLEREPKEYFERFRYKYWFRDFIYGSIEILCFSVLCLSLNAVKMIPSEITLILLILSFLLNAVLLVIFLYYHFESIKLGKTPQPPVVLEESNEK